MFKENTEITLKPAATGTNTKLFKKIIKIYYI